MTTEEECLETADGEKCEGCGETHDHVTLQEVVKKQKRQYHLLVLGYFAAMGVVDYCLYELAGLFAALGFIASFFVYFFHTNMMHTMSIIAKLEQVSMIGEVPGKPKKPVKEEPGMYL